MIYLDAAVHRSVWALAAILLAIGWGLFGLVGHGSRTFLAVMFVLTLLTGALRIVVRPRQGEGTRTAG